MARLYYKHAPAEVIKGPLSMSNMGNWTFPIPRHYMVDDWMYLCVVHEGKVYAGRRITTPASGSKNVLHSVAFTDTETGKQILLKHFLLGD